MTNLEPIVFDVDGLILLRGDVVVFPGWNKSRLAEITKIDDGGFWVKYLATPLPKSPFYFPHSVIIKRVMRRGVLTRIFISFYKTLFLRGPRK